MTESRWILHLDLDQFIAAVEIRRRPELRGLPVVVGGDGDPTRRRQVVATASYEARAFGVRSGMPLSTALRRCPDAVFLASDRAAYDAASAEVWEVVRQQALLVEVWGWDEGFLGTDVDEPMSLAHRLRRVVVDATGFTCCIGVGDNKLRAKLATGFAKAPKGALPEDAPGVFQLTADTWWDLMGQQAPEALWGIGKRTAERLGGLGISTVRELADADLERLRAGFGPTTGPWLQSLARGDGNRTITTEPYVPKGHSREVTLTDDLVRALGSRGHAEPSRFGGPRRSGSRPRGHARGHQGAFRAVLHRHPGPQVGEPDPGSRGGAAGSGRLARPGRARASRPVARGATDAQRPAILTELVDPRMSRCHDPPVPLPPASPARVVELLLEHAVLTPDKAFLRTPAAELSYGEAADAIRRVANGLRGLGVGPGTPVGMLMRNGPEHVVCSNALAFLGALSVPFNTALVGRFLADQLALSGCRLVVVDRALVGVLLEAAAERPPLTLVLVGETSADDEAVAGIPYTDLASAGLGEELVDVDPLAPAMLLFTSGTTGRSKACVLSHRYVLRQGQWHVKHLGLRPDDVLYSPFPLFHIDAATLTVGAAATMGATAAIAPRFSVSGFWEQVRALDATVLNFMGAMIALIWKQPPAPTDRQHLLRLGWGVPMPTWEKDWVERFGFPLYEVYGLTDAGVVCYDPIDRPRRPGTCGRVIDEFEVAIGNPSGDLVAPGEQGEILIRAKEAGTVMNEYLAMPAETQEAFRDGWFHTGDLGRLDADGYLTFDGRSSDSIRRRGENISLREVETAVLEHPDVVEVAAIGVPSALSEEDLMVVVVPRAGSSLAAPGLAEFCAARMPAFMVPRYVELSPELPKTPTEKIEKFRLREQGVTTQTWDRDADRRATTTRAGDSR